MELKNETVHASSPCLECARLWLPRCWTEDGLTMIEAHDSASAQNARVIVYRSTGGEDAKMPFVPHPECRRKSHSDAYPSAQQLEPSAFGFIKLLLDKTPRANDAGPYVYVALADPPRTRSSTYPIVGVGVSSDKASAILKAKMEALERYSFYLSPRAIHGLTFTGNGMPSLSGPIPRSRIPTYSGQRSTGCAAHFDEQSALQGGYFELLEFHAMEEIWCRGSHGLLASTDDFTLASSARAFLSLGYDLELAYLLASSGIFLVLALAQALEPSNPALVIGSAAHTSLLKAAHAASSEAYAKTIHALELKQSNETGLYPAEFQDFIKIQDRPVAETVLNRLILKGVRETPRSSPQQTCGALHHPECIALERGNSLLDALQISSLQVLNSEGPLPVSCWEF